MLSATSFIFPLTFLLPTSPFIHSPPNFPLLANITLTQAGDPEITLDSTISCLSYRFSFLFGLPSWVCLFPDPLSGHSFFLLLARSDYKASLPVFTHHGSSYSVQAGDPEITLDSTISWFNYCFFFFSSLVSHPESVCCLTHFLVNHFSLFWQGLITRHIYLFS